MVFVRKMVGGTTGTSVMVRFNNESGPTETLDVLDLITQTALSETSGNASVMALTIIPTEVWPAGIEIFEGIKDPRL